VVGGFDLRESGGGGENIPFRREKPQLVIKNEGSI
jgi:hypothetical protein